MIYIYICRERKRERERETHTHIYTHTQTCTLSRKYPLWKPENTLFLLQRGKNCPPPKKWGSRCWGFHSGALGNVKYPFIIIIPRFTQTPLGYYPPFKKIYSNGSQMNSWQTFSQLTCGQRELVTLLNIVKASK